MYTGWSDERPQNCITLLAMFSSHILLFSLCPFCLQNGQSDDPLLSQREGDDPLLSQREGDDVIVL